MSKTDQCGGAAKLVETHLKLIKCFSAEILPITLYIKFYCFPIPQLSNIEKLYIRVYLLMQYAIWWK